MKKAITLLFIALLAISATAKEKILINLNEDGMRYIMTDYTTIREGMTDRFPQNVALGVHIVDGDTIWSLCFKVYEDIRINQGDHLLIRTSLGNMIDLQAATDVEDPVGHLESIGMFTNEVHTVMPSYNLTRDQLQELMDYGVVKIRMEISGGMRECELGKKNQSKWAKVLREKYQVIMDTAKIPNGIYDGF